MLIQNTLQTYLDHVCIKYTNDVSIRVSASGVYKLIFYLTIVNKILFYVTAPLGWHDSKPMLNCVSVVTDSI